MCVLVLTFVPEGGRSQVSSYTFPCPCILAQAIYPLQQRGKARRCPGLSLVRLAPGRGRDLLCGAFAEPNSREGQSCWTQQDPAHSHLVRAGACAVISLGRSMPSPPPLVPS